VRGDARKGVPYRDDIIRKITNKIDTSLESIVSSRNPFGIDSREKPKNNGDLILYSSYGNGKIDYNKVKSGFNLINKWKVLLSKTSYDHAGQPDKSGKRRIFSKIEIMPPGSVCTESYLVVGCYNDKKETINLLNYLKTTFCRFLVSSTLLTQNITKNKFCFVPIQDFSVEWLDDKLYKKYDITENEIKGIESLIRPMSFNGEE
jgi:site-specific DNA-methyltransferase (adenine-specific)